MEHRKIYFICCIIIVGLLLSCTNHHNDIAITMSEDVIGKSSTEEIFNIKKTKLVFLEQDSNVLVGEINKMISCKDDLFVLSRSGNDIYNLFRYTLDGQFINKIGSMGGSGKEYIQISTFFIQGDKVYIIDSYRNKMLVYSFDGTFIQSVKGADGDFAHVLDAVSIDDENVLLYNGLNTDPCALFTMYNIPKKKVINEIHTDISADCWGYYSNKRLTRNSNGAFFFLPFDKGIYTINADMTEEKAMQVDYLGEVPAYSSAQYDEIEKIVYDADVSLFWSIFANEQKFLINFMPGSIIWDISQQQGRYIPESLDCTKNIFPFVGTSVKCATEDGFIMVFDDDSFKSIIREHNPSDLFNNSEGEIQRNLYDGSPVIVRFYLK